MWKNAYVHFADKKRMELTKEHPSMDNATISRELGRRWKGLPADERNVWINLAAYDRARYVAECHMEATLDPSPLPGKASALSTTSIAVDTSPEYDMSSFSMMSPHPQSSSQPTTTYGDPLSQFSLPLLDTTPPSLPSSSKKRKRSTSSSGSHVQLAYYYFRRTKRDAVLAANPSMLSADVNREIGRLWQALRPEQKQPWTQLAIAHAKSNQADQSVGAANVRPKLKDPLAPKAPRSAFHFVVEARRMERPDMTYKDVTKEAAHMWRHLPEDKRAPWKNNPTQTFQPLDISIRSPSYEQQIKSYKAPSYARDIVHSTDEASTKPQSAYAHFFHEKRTLYPDLSFVDVTRELSRQWKRMAVDAKRPWLQKALDDKLQKKNRGAHHSISSAHPTEQQQLLDTPKTQQLVDPQDPTTSTACSALEADDSTHLELMEGLWGDDASVTTSMFYEDDLSQSHHHLSLPMMEDMDGMQHHNHPHHSSDMHLQ
ncbi:hypothetical protein DYB37_009734 [Aphanomyces astaci]|uniref:HMG box domain-containing protein n=1 Tax=Aphanomyces astaci TaxID=112090 RepID=A0A3R7ARR3_APHAT|nr:hypothetical protein DYB35_008042 [Aphanomyces astaci]RHZ15118.1 hypothetical protein DYB37_009734 [Aphanomyces astaci]